MHTYIAKRLLVAIPTLLIISVFVFSLQKLLPGDPVLAMAGEERDPQVLEYLREKYHLNDPVPVQYVRWVGSALQGDLGMSLRTRQPVLTLIAQKLPVTIQLAIMSMFFAFVIGIPMGILAAVKKNTVLDYIANIVALSGLSIPNFWLGIMLILLVSVRLGWLPASGYVSPIEDLLGNLKRMVMPAFVLGTGLAAVLMRQTRNSMIEVLSADYVRTARAKGLAGRAVVLRHALRNGLIPVVTILGLQMGALMGGAVVTEQIFVIPGFGRLIVEAVFTRDYPVVQGVVLITASSYVLINLLVDVSYSLLNPRIRIRGAADGA
jgi:peptide/nickel transport system permease protein